MSSDLETTLYTDAEDGGVRDYPDNVLRRVVMRLTDKHSLTMVARVAFFVEAVICITMSLLFFLGSPLKCAGHECLEVVTANVDYHNFGPDNTRWNAETVAVSRQPATVYFAVALMVVGVISLLITVVPKFFRYFIARVNQGLHIVLLFNWMIFFFFYMLIGFWFAGASDVVMSVVTSLVVGILPPIIYMYAQIAEPQWHFYPKFTTVNGRQLDVITLRQQQNIQVKMEERDKDGELAPGTFARYKKPVKENSKDIPVPYRDTKRGPALGLLGLGFFIQLVGHVAQMTYVYYSDHRSTSHLPVVWFVYHILATIMWILTALLLLAETLRIRALRNNPWVVEVFLHVLFVVGLLAAAVTLYLQFK